MPHTLSKSEFKLAFDCYTKLKYKKYGYPKASDMDEFMGSGGRALYGG